MSIFLAKLIGLLYLMIGFGVLINKKYYKEVFEKMIKSEALAFFGGILSFVSGFAIISAHNLWVGDWTVIITLFGWAALVKGVMLILAPRFQLSMAKSVMKSEFYLNLTGVVCVIIGLILCYFSFVA